MNRIYAHAFESLDERAFQMTERLHKLMNGDIDIEDLAGEDLIDVDDAAEHFDLH